MTCAINPQPITPTLSRLTLHPRREYVGTFHGRYTKAKCLSTPLIDRRGQQAGGLGYPRLGCDEGVLVLDGDRADAGGGDHLLDEPRPPARVAAAPDHGEVPGHL